MAKSANEQLFDALIRHQTYLLRYSGYVRNRIVEMLNLNERLLEEKILSRFRGRVGPMGPVDWQRLQVMLDQIKALRMETWEEAKDFLSSEGVGLATSEIQRFDRMIKTVSPVMFVSSMPETRTMRAIALSRPFQGRVLKEWANSLAAEDIRRIHTAIQAGVMSGEGAKLIARRVIGTKVNMGRDGVTQATRTQVEAVVRTAVMHISNSARQEYIRENSDVILGELFVATLDARTTTECKARDGKRYKVGEGPQPPLHYGCRSVRVPELDPAAMGERPMRAHTEKQLLREFAKEKGIAVVGKRADLPYGTKSAFDKFRQKRMQELFGRIPAATTYNEWLKGQSKEFQEDTLGITKAKLFRDGELPLDKFISRTGDELTLRELAQREVEAFRKAGLNPDDYI